MRETGWTTSRRRTQEPRKSRTSEGQRSLRRPRRMWRASLTKLCSPSSSLGWVATQIFISAADGKLLKRALLKYFSTFGKVRILYNSERAGRDGWCHSAVFHPHFFPSSLLLLIGRPKHICIFLSVSVSVFPAASLFAFFTTPLLLTGRPKQIPSYLISAFSLPFFTSRIFSPFHC